MASSTTLLNKVSPLIEGQVPDFVQADHPKFVQFLNSYYQFLEAAEMKISAGIDNLVLEFETPTYILNQDGDKVVLETGSGTTGMFVVGETVKGDTSGATAKVLVQDIQQDWEGNSRLFITSNQSFITGENISGLTSGANATVKSYRGNPIQNIQQFLDYADVDNTIYDFLDEFQYQFMNAVPSTLASGSSKRNLLKSIKQLYTAKGTSEGHKLFMRMLLGEEVDVIYPNKFMIRLSDGQWSTKTIIRVTAAAGASGSEVVGSQITGLESGATAVIVNAVTSIQSNISVTEFELSTETIVGTFERGEQVRALSQTRDINLLFTIQGIITPVGVNNLGVLYSDGETIDTDTTIGNGYADPQVDGIFNGSVDDVFIESAGTNYRIGDTLTFTTTQSNTATAQGFVSAVGGGIAVEAGTVQGGSDEVNVGDNIVLEEGTNQSIIQFEFSLEDGTGALYQEDGTTGSGLGDVLQAEDALSQVSMDRYGTSDDLFLLETETFADLTPSVPAEKYSIRKVFLTNGGSGYSSLPTVTISSANGSGATLFASTNTIGGVSGIKMSDVGFNYTSAPDARFRANVVVKSPSGTFVAGNTLTTHHGTVKSYDANTRVLKVTVDRGNSIVQDTAANANDDILLEDGNFCLLEDNEQYFKGNTITDSGGATASIHKADIATGTLAQTVVHTDVGYYDSFSSKLGEDTVRLQDSYYYQDFSYEIQAGAAASDYMTELKKAVHPTGFEAFGKVSLASLVSAAIHDRSAGASVPGFDTDTFSPVLASAIVTLFTTVFGRRLATAEQRPNLQSSPLRGYDVPEAQGNDILTAGARDITLTNYLTTFLTFSTDTPFITNRGRTALYQLNTNAVFGREVGETGIQLEDGTNASSGLSVTQSQDLLLLDGVDSSLDNLLSSQVGDVGSVMMMEEDINVNNGVSLGEIGTLKFNEIYDGNGQSPSTVWTATNTPAAAYPAEIFTHASGELINEDGFHILDEDGNEIDLEAQTFYQPFGPHPSSAATAESHTFDSELFTTFDETSMTFDSTTAN